MYVKVRGINESVNPLDLLGTFEIFHKLKHWIRLMFTIYKKKLMQKLSWHVTMLSLFIFYFKLLNIPFKLLFNM